MTVILDWQKCYGKMWGNVVTPDTMTHPAKFSRNLIERIYTHSIEQGYIKPGDTVGDPFGGVALGAWPALRRNINWIGVELEAKFVGLGNANLDLWRKKYKGMFHWGNSQLLQGDSRQFASIVRGALGAVVSSPPYATSTDGHGDIAPRGSDDVVLPRNYGNTPGQLGAMEEGHLVAVVGSPPYEESMSHKAGGQEGIESTGAGGPIQPRNYARTPDNLGNQHGDTFWGASRQIVEQCHLALASGGMSVWVVKHYIKDKKLVDFPGQWQQLCEACGFEPVELARAWVTTPEWVQTDLFGGEAVEKREYKSFFRRLAEGKGSPRIDFETVLFMRKVG